MFKRTEGENSHKPNEGHKHHQEDKEILKKQIMVTL